MKLTDFTRTEPIALGFTAQVFPTNCLTLLHGPQGSGKSYTAINELNKEGIKPVYIAVEDSFGLSGLDKHYVDESILNHMMKGEDIDGLDGQVVIIDTYTRLQFTLIKEGYDHNQILTMLERIRCTYNITLIIIGHTRNFVGKDGIFDDNPVLARGVAEELFIEKSSYKATKTQEARVEYNLHVIKGRGNGGSRIIPHWGREVEEEA